MAQVRIPLPKTVGILGGGQLARMLSHSAQRMGFQVKVLSKAPSDPGAQVTSSWVESDLKSPKTIGDFCKTCDLVTVESEFLDLSQVKGIRGKLFPAVETLGLLRDRKSQKAGLDQFKIPTAPWTTVDTPEDLITFFKKQNAPVVCKQRTHGYDGYGTFVLKTEKSVKQFIQSQSEKGLFPSGQFIAEGWIPFQRELAVIIARSGDGSFGWLPFVESYQKDSRCDWVKGPVKSHGFEKVLRSLARFLKGLNYVGVMGVEFFKTSQGLLVNEIAPRVHNTGHYSMNTPGPSQFDLHWLCGLGLSVKGLHPQGPGFAMANLLGQESPVIELPSPGAGWLHWYGKTKNSKGRKMGHLNTLDRTGSLALQKALKIRKRGKY